MPNRELHNLFDFHYLGCKYEQFAWVHDLLDHGTNISIDYVKLFGAKHRHFFHDDKAVQWIEANYGAMPALVARLHICLDIVWSRGKREMNGIGRRNKR